MFRLPVSGLEVSLRPLSGAEELLLLDAREYDTWLTLRLLAGVARLADGAEVEWDALTLTDVEALLLLLRQAVFGDWIRADLSCPTEGCGARVEVAFRVSDYLDYHRPRTPRNVEAAGEAGWFRLRGAPVQFRLPSGGDQMVAASRENPTRELVRLCVNPPELSGRLLRRVEAAMGALAPSLADGVRGRCPNCGASIEIIFDPQHFCLRELRGQAAYLYEDMHLLARHYHWSEAEIVALPRHRRIQYVEMIRQEGV
jgi:hypothetical protein